MSRGFALFSSYEDAVFEVLEYGGVWVECCEFYARGLFAFCYFVDGSGISSRYFPWPDMFNFQVFTSITLVAWNLSSSQMARKGLQKMDVMGFQLSLFDVKNSASGFFLNINPRAFSSGFFNVFTFILFFFPLT